MRRPLASASACIFVLRPPRERPIACFCSPFSARCRAMRFDVGGIDHLRICGSSATSKRSEQVFPNPTPRPAHEAVIDRCRRTIFGRAIAPAAATFQHVYDAADDTAIVGPLDTPYIRRQVGFDPLPLLIAQPKQALAHDPNPLPKSNQDRIVRPEKLMSSDPNIATSDIKVRWAGDVRARAGYLLTPATLAYGTVGWATAGISDLKVEGISLPIERAHALTLGTGIEAALSEHWHLRADYIYFITNSLQIDANGAGISATDIAHARATGQKMRLGLIYQFASH